MVFDRRVTVTLSTPDVDALDDAVLALREWQHDGTPVPLHPGDLGWHRRLGAETTAAAVRVWSRDGQALAVGLLDAPGLVRFGIAPAAERDEELADRMAADLTRPERGVLPAGPAAVEVRCGAALRSLLTEAGWHDDEPWTPLRRDLARPVEPSALRVEEVDAGSASEWTAVLASAFGATATGDERWRAMTAGTPYPDARCLLGYDERDVAVAVAGVWAAGSARPGLIEPLGVHRDHRGRGYGREITVAAAAALQQLGSSSAVVATPSANTGAVATYVAAGFERLPDVRDVARAG